MCELLIHLGFPDSGDPEVEKGRYKLGDVIVVREDGAHWAKMETKPAWVAAGNAAEDFPNPFFLLKIPGLSADTVQAALEEADEDLVPGPSGIEPVMKKRRKNRFDMDDASALVSSALAGPGEITATVNQVKNFLKRKTDGAVLDLGL